MRGSHIGGEGGEASEGEVGEDRERGTSERRRSADDKALVVRLREVEFGKEGWKSYEGQEERGETRPSRPATSLGPARGGSGAVL